MQEGICDGCVGERASFDTSGISSERLQHSQCKDGRTHGRISLKFPLSWHPCRWCIGASLPRRLASVLSLASVQG